MAVTAASTSRHTAFSTTFCGFFRTSSILIAIQACINVDLFQIMKSTETKKHIEHQLSPRLVKELYRLARTYRNLGVRLFVFGSFARGSNQKTSDLDLGVLWNGKRSSRVFTRLYRDVQELPTIRKIELVDMEQVDDIFKNHALAEAVFLSDGEEIHE